MQNLKPSNNSIETWRRRALDPTLEVTRHYFADEPEGVARDLERLGMEAQLERIRLHYPEFDWQHYIDAREELQTDTKVYKRLLPGTLETNASHEAMPPLQPDPDYKLGPYTNDVNVYTGFSAVIPGAVYRQYRPMLNDYNVTRKLREIQHRLGSMLAGFI